MEKVKFNISNLAADQNVFGNFASMHEYLYQNIYMDFTKVAGLEPFKKQL